MKYYACDEALSNDFASFKCYNTGIYRERYREVVKKNRLRNSLFSGCPQIVLTF